MRNVIRICFLICIIRLAGTLALPAHAASPLPRSTPEAQGVSSAALSDFVNALDQIDGMHSLMVLRHGHVIAEGWWAPYDAAHNHILYSLSKSFTSTAVGLAVAESKLSIDDEVLKFFPDDAPTNTTKNLKAMRLRDLLIMSTGHQEEPSAAADLVSAKSFLAQPVPHLPGTHFKYNTAGTFMQSAIVQKVTGQTVLDFLRPRLFEPLGIEHPVWDANFQGISLGGYGLRVRTEDIAKFGQLYLQKGRWNGKQLLPTEWVAMATAKQTSNGSDPQSDWNQGYGFQFWRCRHNAYRGDGAFGQYCVVMPDQDAVVAITSGVKDMQAILNIIWDKLLPAIDPHDSPSPLNGERAGVRGGKVGQASVSAGRGVRESSSSAVQQLKDKLAHLRVRTPEGSATSPLASKILNRKFNFTSNNATNDQRIETMTLSSSDSGKTLTLTTRIDGKEVLIPCGYHEWKKSRAPLVAGKLAYFPDEPTAGSFAWPHDDTCIIKLCAYETSYHTTLTLKFDGDQMTLDSELNVAFGPTKRPRLLGRAN